MIGLRVATWNVHGCLGTDGLFAPDRIAGVLHRVQADVVALQEVYDSRQGTRDFDGFAFFERHCGPHAVAAVTIRGNPHRYGHMVCSRWPVAWAVQHDISVAGREPRMLIDMAVRHPDGQLRVLATHFGLRLRERRLQSAQLQHLLLRDLETPTVVLGDFNETRRRGGVFRGLAAQFASPSAPATFPARRPLFALDRIWCRPRHLIRELGIWPEDRHASDHLPVVADLRLP